MFDPPGIIVRNNRANERFLISRIAHHQSLNGFDKLITKRSINIAMNVNPLHADTTLAGLIIAAEQASVDGVSDVRIVIDNYRGVAAQFQRDVLLAGPIAKPPTN